jgi:NitT/TauT family transport system substrate-binding protein
MTAMNRRSVLLFGSAFSIGLLTATVARAETGIRFIIDWSFQGQHAMFTMPVDDGTYAKLGLNVKVDRGAGSGDTVAKVASGAYDMGLADIYSMVRFNNQNPDHKLIAVMMVDDKSALAVEVKASGPIKSPQDLNGKTLAAPVGDATRQLFPLFAAANKIDENSIKWINVSPELREPLLVRGEADAITGHLTTVMLNFANIGMKASDIRTMPYIDFGVNLLGHAVVVKPEFAEKNPDVIRNFIRGSAHGFNAMVKDPDAAVASIKKQDPLINPELEKSRIEMSLSYRMITDNVLKNGISNVEASRLESSLKEVAGPFGINPVPAASDVYTDRYLPPPSEMKLVR